MRASLEGRGTRSPADLRPQLALWAVAIAAMGIAMALLGDRTFGFVVIGIAVLSGTAGWILFTRKLKAALRD